MGRGYPWVHNDRDELVSMGSFAFIAYQEADGWVGVCEQWPLTTRGHASGALALRAVKLAVFAAADESATMLGLQYRYTEDDA